MMTFNGIDLAGFASTGAYYSDPAAIDIDVSSLVTSGVNTLSTFATMVSGEPLTYALGEITLTYDSTPAVPEPATSGLLLVGIAALVVGASLRRRATPAA
ncbi:MAG: PEP-CTERM sorting domain-containing protein [Burkholderiales bacterium]